MLGVDPGEAVSHTHKRGYGVPKEVVENKKLDRHTWIRFDDAVPHTGDNDMSRYAAK